MLLDIKLEKNGRKKSVKKMPLVITEKNYKQEFYQFLKNYEADCGKEYKAATMYGEQMKWLVRQQGASILVGRYEEEFLT